MAASSPSVDSLASHPAAPKVTAWSVPMRFLPLSLTLILAACATKPPVAPVAAPPPPGLSRLVGIDATAVTRLLGPASLDRSEGPGRQMQFVRPPCVLDVFLYPPATGGTAVVRTAAARKPDGSKIDPGTCLSLIAPATDK
jgi:hypothetical protein